MGFIKTVFDYFSSDTNKQNTSDKEKEQEKIGRSPIITEWSYEEILSGYVDRLSKIRKAKSYASFSSGSKTYYIRYEKNGLFRITPDRGNDAVADRLLLDLKERAMGELLASSLVIEFLKCLALSSYNCNQEKKSKDSKQREERYND